MTSQENVFSRYLMLGVGIILLAVGFGLWPYQHWNSLERESVLVGWYKMLSYSVNADWQFCYFVPFITGYLVYRQRDELRNLPIQGSWLGIPVLLFAALCYWLGFRVDTGYMGYASLQLFLAGWVLLFGGIPWMRALFLPWLFLFFSWPLFPLDNLLAARLKIPTAWSAEKLLDLVGIGTVRVGSTLFSEANAAANLAQGAKFTLDVADSCSGMRSLYSLIMISMLYSIIGLKGTVNRIILIVSAIPLAILGNVARLLILAFGCLLFGQEFAVGKKFEAHQEDSFFHLLAGFIVFGVALAGMFLIATWLEGRHWKALGKKKKKVSTSDTSWNVNESQSKVIQRSLGALGCLVVALAMCKLFPTDPALSTPGIAPILPATVPGYESTRLEMSYREKVVFDAGVKLDRREYIGVDGSRIVGTLVMSGEMKKSLHTPELCLPDQGWTISTHEEIPIKLKDGREITASIMRLHRDVQIETGEIIRIRGLNLYWYIGSEGIVTPSYKMSHFYTYRDSILFNFNHHWSQAAFYMQLPEIRADGQDLIGEIIAQQQLADFAGQAASEFMLP